MMKNNWQTKKLGELFDITSSKRVFKSEWKVEGVPFYRAREIVKLAKDGYVNNELFISENMYNKYSEKYGAPMENDIMVTGVGTLGICYVVKKNDKFYFKDGNIIWLKNKGLADSRFIEYMFKSEHFIKQINNNSGTTVGTFTIIKAKNMLIILPLLDEQKRIVKKLDAIFENIDKAKENTEKNLQNSKELFDSYLFSEFANTKKDSNTKILNEVCIRITDGSHNPPKSVNKNEYLMLSSKNIFNDHITLGDPRYLSKTDFNIENKRTDVSEGDVLLTIVGTIGRVAVYNSEYPKFTLQRSVAVLKPDLNIIEPRYLMYSLRSKIDKIQNQSRGVAQKGFYLKQIKNFSINLPAINNQRITIKKIDKLSEQTKKLEENYKQKLLLLDELKKSVLAKAFAGEL
jgi:type I restriction enzyme S subunit